MHRIAGKKAGYWLWRVGGGNGEGQKEGKVRYLPFSSIKDRFIGSCVCRFPKLCLA
jgi:hypothetical protein